VSKVSETMQQTINVALIGAGMIAKVFAGALHQTQRARLVAVASRRPEQAATFASEVAGPPGTPRVFPHWREMLEAPGIDAVFISTPTAGREEIGLATLDSGRHLIYEKPFLDAASAERLAKRAQERGIAFMDATHFTHHPRTQTIREMAAKEIGRIHSVNSVFFFPFMDRSNIRFKAEAEPTGAIGDMAWYNMRAIVEYMQPGDTECTITGAIRRDSVTGSVIGGAGLVSFVDGRSSTFAFGYDAGVCIQDVTLLGENGLMQWPDLVLDYSGGFAFNNPEHKTGFAIRQGMQTRSQERFVEAHSQAPQLVRLIENFADLCHNNDATLRGAAATRAIQTQRLVDTLAHAVLGTSAAR
jgi:predicted dehydrogenase